MKIKIMLIICIFLLMINIVVADTAVAKFNITNAAPTAPYGWSPLTTHGLRQNFTWYEGYDINSDTVYNYMCMANTSTDRDNENCNVKYYYGDNNSSALDGTETNLLYAYDNFAKPYYVKLISTDLMLNSTENATIYFNLTDYVPTINTANTSSYIDTDEVLDVVANIGEDVDFNIESYLDTENDNLSIIVCKTDSLEQNGTCSSGTWCSADYTDNATLTCSLTLTVEETPTNSNQAYFFTCDCPPYYQNCPARCSNSSSVTFYANHAPTMDAPIITWTN